MSATEPVIARPSCLKSLICSAKSNRINHRSALQFHWATAIEEMSGDWEEVAPEGRMFFQRSFLKALEEAPPRHTSFGYLLIYRFRRPVGLLVLQRYEFSAARALNALRDDSSLFGRLKLLLANCLRLRVMVCGNLLLSGPYGYYFKPDAVPEAERERLLREALDFAAGKWAAAGCAVDAVLVKDRPVSEPSLPAFQRLSFQPSMIFDLPGNWAGFEDYLAALSSKYRVRYRRARKKAQGISRRELQGEEGRRLAPQLHELYRAVAGQADFNLVELPQNYFQELAEMLGKDFHLWGYFQEERLIGFSSAIVSGFDLEAHFLGFEEAANREHQLYLNMLYDMVEEGINRRMQRVVFARTALEIKSSVGATAEELALYFKSNKHWLHHLVPHLVRLLQPAADWMPRNPFAKEAAPLT